MDEPIRNVKPTRTWATKRWLDLRDGFESTQLESLGAAAMNGHGRDVRDDMSQSWSRIFQNDLVGDDRLVFVGMDPASLPSPSWSDVVAAGPTSTEVAYFDDGTGFAPHHGKSPRDHLCSCRAHRVAPSSHEPDCLVAPNSDPSHGSIHGGLRLYPTPMKHGSWTWDGVEWTAGECGCDALDPNCNENPNCFVHTVRIADLEDLANGDLIDNHDGADEVVLQCFFCPPALEPFIESAGSCPGFGWDPEDVGDVLG